MLNNLKMTVGVVLTGAICIVLAACGPPYDTDSHLDSKPFAYVQGNIGGYGSQVNSWGSTLVDLEYSIHAGASFTCDYINGQSPTVGGGMAGNMANVQVWVSLSHGMQCQCVYSPSYEEAFAGLRLSDGKEYAMQLSTCGEPSGGWCHPDPGKFSADFKLAVAAGCGSMQGHSGAYKCHNPESVKLQDLLPASCVVGFSRNIGTAVGVSLVTSMFSHINDGASVEAAIQEAILGSGSGSAHYFIYAGSCNFNL